MTIEDRPAGTVWIFAEADYRFGAGPLRIHIDRVLAPLQHDGDLWYEVEGVEISDQGQVIGPRRVTVRASRLPTMRRGTP